LELQTELIFIFALVNTFQTQMGQLFPHPLVLGHQSRRDERQHPNGACFFSCRMMRCVYGIINSGWYVSHHRRSGRAGRDNAIYARRPHHDSLRHELYLTLSVTNYGRPFKHVMSLRTAVERIRARLLLPTPLGPFGGRLHADVERGSLQTNAGASLTLVLHEPRRRLVHQHRHGPAPPPPTRIPTMTPCFAITSPRRRLAGAYEFLVPRWNPMVSA